MLVLDQILDSLDMIDFQVCIECICVAPKLGGPLTNRQPEENSWVSGAPIPHYVSHLPGSTNLTTKWPLRVHLSIFI